MGRTQQTKAWQGQDPDDQDRAGARGTPSLPDAGKQPCYVEPSLSSLLPFCSDMADCPHPPPWPLPWEPCDGLQGPCTPESTSQHSAGTLSQPAQAQPKQPAP